MTLQECIQTTPITTALDLSSSGFMADYEKNTTPEVTEPVKEETVSVFHILVVGFHHQKGCTVEYIHPPLTSSTKDSSLTNQLPPEWRHLPHLALPDGCHNYEEDASYFILHAHEGMVGGEGMQAVYGVACCRQIDSKEVKPSVDVTRSTVQKSVCVLSKYPFFGSVEAKLSQVTQAYFEVKDFSDISILHDAMSSLNSTFSSTKPPLGALQVGLSQQSQILKFGHRLLQIFKALLLHKRVLVCGVPTNEVCKTILGILSLFPKALESFVKPGQKTADDCGFPLQIFTSPFSIQPYLCLQQMDTLAVEDSHLLVGVANPLFQKHYSKYCDVYVNMEDSVIDVKDAGLRSILYLTSADLRFCDYVLTSVQEVTSATPNWNPSKSATGWFGSNEWVRSQFKLYLLSLLSTSLCNQRESVEDFGHRFMEQWLKSFVFVNWKLSHKKCAGMAKVEPVHVCHGDMTLKDIKLRLSVQASEYGISDQSKERVGQVLWQTQQAIGSVGGAVGGVWSAASSAVSSWWSGGGDDGD